MIDRKNFMVAITKNKQAPHFHCGSLENERKKKEYKVSKTIKKVRH